MLLYKFLLYVLAFFIVFFSTKANSDDCGQSETEERLLNRKNVTEGQWPWMVAILRKKESGENTHWCNGFLIDRRHVLSAAHCFKDKDIEKKLFSARIGSVNSKEGEEYSVADITLHEKYEPGFFYEDIAILTLNRDVDIPNFNPVCLPDAQLSRENLIGSSTVVVGWGTEKPHGALSHYLRQYSRMTVISNQVCNLALQNYIPGSFSRQLPRGINQSIICGVYTGEEKDVCGIVSGGPLMIYKRNRWFAVGFLSFGKPCFHPEVPTGFVRISTYLNWIKDITGD